MSKAEGMKTSQAEHTTHQYLNRILIKNSEKNIFIDVGKINWIESSGNYVKLHMPDCTHLIRGTLKTLEQKLDPLRFIRIHRSSMVNVNKVKVIEPWFSGDFKVILENGKTLKMSRNYKETLDRFKLN